MPPKPQDIMSFEDKIRLQYKYKTVIKTSIFIEGMTRICILKEQKQDVKID